MKTKIRASCQKEKTCLYRLQIILGKSWVLVFLIYCIKVKNELNYRYGGICKDTGIKVLLKLTISTM